MSKQKKSRLTNFSLLKSHKRFRTQNDVLRQRFQTQNNFSKNNQPKSNRFSDFDLIESLKENKIELKKDNYCDKFEYENKDIIKKKCKLKYVRQKTQCTQRQHPLKTYINSRYKMNHNRSNSQIQPSIQLLKAFKLISTSYNKQVQVQNTKKQLQNLYVIIEEIFKKLQKFKEIGYPEKKINDWILKYCVQRRKYMIHLLMRPISKHKFTNSIQYTYEKYSHIVKNKLFTVRKVINGKNQLIDQFDLLQFSHYLENILIQKNKIKLTQLKASIKERLEECFIYNRQMNAKKFGKKLQPAEIKNFVSDMNLSQQKNGQFSLISKFNRQYFIELGIIQKQIKNKIYDLLHVTQKKDQSQKEDLIPKNVTYYESLQSNKKIIVENLNECY